MPTFGVTLGNRSQWISSALFAGSQQLVLHQLVTLATSNAHVATVNATSGVVTLMDHSADRSSLTITAVDSGLVSSSVTAVGDVDAGPLDGLPLGSQAVGSTCITFSPHKLLRLTLRLVDVT